MLAPGAVIAGRFHVIAHAGTGGMGSVYRAHDTATEREVAIKLLHLAGKSDRQRFLREAEVLAKLAHPAIAEYVAHGADDDGAPFLAMSWIEGETLRARLREGPLSIDETVAIAEGVASALGCAHASGVVHRDLKPANVILRGGDPSRPLLIDFGVARVTVGVSELTTAGDIVGTPGYMAPEQARGDATVGPAADVFSLGCVLFRCLAHRAPFEGDSLLAVLAKILLEDAPRVRSLRPDVPAHLDALVASMLAKDERQRPKDGVEVTRRLKSAVEPDRAATRTPTSLTEREQRLVTLVLARQTLAPSEDTPTIVDRSGAREVVEQAGGRLEWLVDGTALVSLVGKGDAAAQALVAARCARALSGALRGWSVALATGLGRVDAGVPMGQVIDRAASLLSGTPLADEVAVDDVTAGLLGGRFDVASRGDRRVLGQEHVASTTTRTLLGKPAPFVGREREIKMLADLFEECVSESSARVATIIGAPGVGKSRLRDELVRRLDGRARVWIGRADASMAKAPLSTLAGAVRRAARVIDNEPAVEQREKLGAFAAEISGDRALLDDLVAYVGTSSQAEHAGRGDGLAMADRARRFFEDLFVHASSAGPLLLILEDLQWADAQSVQTLDGALRLAEELPLFVLGVARPEVDDVFPRVWSQRGAQPVMLRELGKRAAEKLTKDVLGDAATPAVLERVVSRAGGNAFYLEELIRAVAEGSSDELPQTLMATVSGRLDQLDPRLRRVLRAGSVFGLAFWERGAAALLGERDVSEALGELVDRELCTARASARFAQERELVFRHALVREAAYASLTDADRTLGHRLAAEWLVRVGEPDAAVIAEHFDRAGEPLRSASMWGRAAITSLEGGDMPSAIVRAERASAADLPPIERAQAMLVAAEVHRWRGEFTDSLTKALRALPLLPVASALAFDALGEIAIAAGRLGDKEELSRAAAVLLEHPPDARTANAWAIAASRACAYLMFTGESAPADALLARYEALPELGLAARARLHQTRSIRAQLDGDLERLVRELMAAEVAYVESGDVRGVCNVRMNVAFGLTQVGLYEEALTRLELCLADAERSGLGGITSGTRGNIILSLAALGRVDRMRALAATTLPDMVQQGDLRMAASTCCYLSAALRRAGDLASALDTATRAVEYAGNTTFVPMALAARAEALLANGDPNGALRDASEAKRLLDERGEVEEGDAVVRLAWGRALAANDRLAEASVAMADARRRVLETAERIADERMRESFLRIAEHRETLAESGVSEVLGAPEAGHH